MDQFIKNRVTKEAAYIIQTGVTIRKVAKRFNISKSTVHKDLQERLKIISPKNYRLVREIIKKKRIHPPYQRRRNNKTKIY